MKKTVDHARMRSDLLNATVRVIAEHGIEGCTSKKIALESGLNEAYIFRYFLDLKDLRRAAFFYVEEHIFVQFGGLLALHPEEENPEERMRKIFLDSWRILMDSREEELFFLRYFVSTEFTGEVMSRHLENCKKYLFRGTGAESENKVRLGSAALVTEFLYAANVHCRFLEDNEETRNTVYQHIM